MAPSLSPEPDFLPLVGLDHVEFYVGNARQAAHYYRSALGLELVAYQGPETGIHDRASYVLSRGSIRFVLTAALRPNHPIADHVYRYGDSVRSIALTVEDAKAAFSEVKQRGGQVVQDPMEFRDEFGVVRTFAMATCGDTVHTFVERHEYRGNFQPGYVGMTGPDRMAYLSGIEHIDQITLSATQGSADSWKRTYENVLSFVNGRGDELTKRTQAGQLMRFRIQENARDAGVVAGDGVSQIAFSTADLAATVGTMLSHGVEFHQTGRAAELDEVFVVTKPVEDRPSLTFRIVEKKRTCV